jgi:hypothetical protein
MATIKPDINITRGDDTSIGFELTNNGVPVDLTGSTVFFTAKPALTDDSGDTNAVISVEVTNHTDPTNGITSIPLTATDTDVDPAEYYYDIQVKKQDTTIVSIRYRKLKVWADVTRRTS